MDDETGKQEIETGDADQTNAAGAETDVEIDDTDESNPPETVPYKTFKATREKLKEQAGKFDLTAKELAQVKAELGDLSAYKEFIADLKADGIKNTDEVRAFIAHQNMSGLQKNLEAATAKATQDYHAAIADGSEAKDVYPVYKLAIDRAQLVYDKALLDQQKAEIKRTSTGSVASRIQALLAPDKYPLADRETLQMFAQIPGTDLEAQAKRLHNREAERQVEYTKQKTTQKDTKSAPTKAGSNADVAAVPVCPDPLKDPKGAQKWLDMLTAKTKAAVG